MRILLKISKILSVTVLTVILLLIILAAILEPQISRLFIQKINGSLTGRVEAGRINFSLLKSFPRASVELKDLTIYTPSAVGVNGQRQPDDTLISANRLFVSLKLAQLIKKQYIIESLSIDRGKIFIREDSDGKTNLGIVKKGERGDTSMVNIELRNIRIDDTRLRFISDSRDIGADLLIHNADNRLSLSSEKSWVEVNSTFTLNSFRHKEFSLISVPGNIRFSTLLTIDPDQIVCEKASLVLLGSEIGISFVLNPSEKIIAADFNISPTDIDPLIKLFNLQGGDSSAMNNISGVISANGSVNGSFSDKNLPPVKASVNIEKGLLKIPGKKISISSFSASGTLEIDPDDPARTFSVTLPSLAATINNSEMRGSLNIKNLDRPSLDLILSGDVESSDLSALFNPEIIKATGVIRTNLRLFGLLPAADQIRAEDLLGLSHSVSLNFRSVHINLPTYGIDVEKIMGNVMVADNVWLDGITLSHDGSIIAMNGMLAGFSEWLTSPQKPLSISAGLWSNRLDSDLITGIAGKLKANGGSDKKRSLFSNISINLDLKLDSLIIKEFRSSMVSAEITYSNNFINIGSFSLNSLGGNLEGNAAIARLSSGRFVGKGWFDIAGIDIRETFSVFNNFGQRYITDKNLGGSLIGSLNITTELDSRFKTDLNTLKLSGSYRISSGELIEFEPVMKLSKFVELSELSNIHFSELQNSILIENRSVSIPSMEIRSSAFDLSLSGNHSFDGIYTYHLKLLLSDLLSRKARENNSNISEFGIIEDDGLGKTSLYLRIEGTGGDSKVSYDMKNLKVDIKKNVVEEKVTLKTILKQEYGWYTGDSLVPIQKEETRKFRIIWEEADSIKNVEPPTQEKILPLKGLFRKKKGGENANQ